MAFPWGLGFLWHGSSVSTGNVQRVTILRDLRQKRQEIFSTNLRSEVMSLLLYPVGYEKAMKISPDLKEEELDPAST